MEIDLRSLPGLLLKLALTAAAGAPAVYIWLLMLDKNNSRADVICGGIGLLITLYAFGIVCSLLYSGSAAEGLTDFLLYPRRYIKAPPVILSRPQGLIASGRFEEAELELIALRSKAAGSPEITLMLARLHAEYFNAPEAAAADCRFYFSHRSWRYHELNLQIALKYADYLEELGRPEEARQRLLKEKKASFYPETDRKTLLLRAQSLGQQRSEK